MGRIEDPSGLVRDRVGEGELSRADSSLHDFSGARRAEEERKAIMELLKLIHSCSDNRDLVRALALFLRSWSGCEAVAVRLRDGDDFPYVETRGFSENFLRSEDRLCLMEEESGQLKEETCKTAPRCLCGGILRGSSDTAMDCFTEYGSFWTNSTTALPVGTAQSLCLADGRGKCRAEGFESVALIPLSAAGEIYGLLQFNDGRRNRFTAESVSFLETIADNVAIVLAQKRAEEERLRLVTAVEQAAECFLLADRNRVIRYANPAFERLSGYSRDEVVGRDCGFLRSCAHEDSVCKAIWESVGMGKVWNGRIVNKSKDDIPYETETTISPVLDAIGKIRDYVIIQRDVSGEARLERQLRQAQKMEALGTLAGGIAHDFNNILAPIVGYVEMALDEVPEGSRLSNDLHQVQKAARRARDLVKQILTFSRQTEKEKYGPVRVSLMVKEALKLLRASLPSTIEIRHIIPRSAAGTTVITDPTQIHQVLMNLCTNSAHAMREKGGVLEVSLAERVLESEHLTRYPELKPGTYVQLSVRDTGHGMREEIRQRIFDPYFTTKGSGEGTGMGLAVVYGIVKNSGGLITVYSEPGKGTVFHVFLPAAKSVRAPRPEVPGPMPTGHGRVLFVDDEKVIVDMATMMLKRLGYEVVGKSDSRDALETFRADPESFDLIVTDLTMPNLTGIELAEAILHTRPDTPIILCTGFSEPTTAEKAREVGILEILLKPLVMRDLADVMNNLLKK